MIMTIAHNLETRYEIHRRSVSCSSLDMLFDIMFSKVQFDGRSALVDTSCHLFSHSRCSGAVAILGNRMSLSQKYIDRFKSRDAWFDKYWLNKVTDEFCEWWIKFYDEMEAYDDVDDDHEYLMRMAFAFMGWSANK